MKVISQKVLEDEQAVSLAEAVAVANEVAREAGVYDEGQMRLRVEEAKTKDGTLVWRVHYFLIPPPGVYTRGGDYMVEVLRETNTVHSVMRGQ